VRYPGGKGKCFQQIINLMPRHKIYIESHLGGGAVLRHKRAAEVSFALDVDPGVIARWTAQPIEAVHFVCADAVSFLTTFPYGGDELVYADPPYLASTRRRARVYRHEYTFEDHGRLLETLKSLPCRVMLSGYASDLYENALHGWTKASFPAKTHTDVREECLWMNFLPTHKLHDATHLGATFRKRQDIKRRSMRMIHRFERMHPAEREQLLRTLHHRFNPEESSL
jgi:DNA adenine methylase